MKKIAADSNYRDFLGWPFVNTLSILLRIWFEVMASNGMGIITIYTHNIRIFP